MQTQSKLLALTVLFLVFLPVTVYAQSQLLFNAQVTAPITVHREPRMDSIVVGYLEAGMPARVFACDPTCAWLAIGPNVWIPSSGVTPVDPLPAGIVLPTPLPTTLPTPSPTLLPTVAAVPLVVAPNVTPIPPTAIALVQPPTPIVTPTSTPIGQASTQPPSTQPAAQQGGVGQDVFVGEVRWKILSAENLGNTLTSDNEFIEPKTTAGKFIRVRFEMENRSTDLRTYAGINLVDSQGRSFIISSSVYSYIPDNEDCSFENLNPNVPRVCNVIFEVAADSAGLRAKVGDLETFGTDEALIDLGF